MTTAAVPLAGSSRWPSSSDGLRAAALCAVLSIALHGLLLSLRLPASSPAEGRQSRMSHDNGLRSRVVTLLLPPSASPASPSGAGRQAAEEAGTHARPLDAQQNPPSEKSPAKLGPQSGSNVVEPAPLASEATLLPRSGSFSDDYYVPRSLLSVPPVAITPVIFAPPPDEMTGGRYVGTLSLFIDEHGQVQRIVSEDPSLPEAFELAAREAFMATQFTPGEIDGTAVKSRVRVEVAFDDTPILER